MIRNAPILFCDNEHGTGDVCFPDVKQLDGHDLQQQFIKSYSIRSLRNAAKAIGWGRVNGGDYCPDCMETM